MLVPFWIIVVASLSSEQSIATRGYRLFVNDFSLEAYKFIASQGTVFRAYGVSLFVTLVGTAIAVTITTMMAYAISRRYFKYRNFFAFAAYFTMLFSGGLVPWYIQVSQLGLRDTIWALILPMVFSPFNMLLIRNFLRSLPEEMIESAKIDGANEYRTFIQIVLPLALPGLATITLFYMLAFWNDWWLALNFITDPNLFPLQFLLRQVLSKVSFAVSGMQDQPALGTIPAETVRMATTILTVGPIIFVYPFIQKYFIKGIMVGAIKG